jgi:putative aminopeptidase FrvX
MRKQTAERYLRELTSLPTAAGREGRVVAWIERWAKRREGVAVKRDRFGNLLIHRKGQSGRSPLVFAAHMDHPAFVVTGQTDPRTILAEFRGGVADAFFKGASVQLHRHRGLAVTGVVERLSPPVPPELDKSVAIKLDQPVAASVGDVVTWRLDPASIDRGRLHAPACDDLAGVAAAVVAFEKLPAKRKPAADVRLLFTRAEEVGFVGALGACRSGILPRRSRIVALENSKSFADSPIGGGPIVRVGDRTSTFDPDLTYRIGRVAHRLADRDPAFKWQRKLRPGGTCEASAYQSLGYTATCVCLPLGNYHNMDDATGRIDRETIALDDFHGLVRLLVGVADLLDTPDGAPPLKKRLEKVFAERRHLLSD